MARRFGFRKNGSAFPSATVKAVWHNGRTVPGKDAAVWRLDACGAFMKFDDYGDTSSDVGWEIDHIKPVAEGGTDDIDNLQPLQWENNRHKRDNWPEWDCAVSAKK